MRRTYLLTSPTSTVTTSSSSTDPSSLAVRGFQWADLVSRKDRIIAEDAETVVAPTPVDPNEADMVPDNKEAEVLEHMRTRLYCTKNDLKVTYMKGRGDGFVVIISPHLIRSWGFNARAPLKVEVTGFHNRIPVRQFSPAQLRVSIAGRVQEFDGIRFFIACDRDMLGEQNAAGVTDYLS